MATGRLSGKPGVGDVGTFDDIVITATDGLHTVSLPAFSLQVLESETAVEQATTGGFTVNWTAPKNRADGTALTLAEIGGYRIYYGDAVGHYSYMLEVGDETAESATITDVPASTIYVVMTTYDIYGRESDFSAVIAKTL
jgi:4-hydroxyphenylpyruvate dioxygenase-like putative hemolysin